MKQKSVVNCQQNDRLIPRTAAQCRYIESLTDNALTIGLGPAGVGKTYVASRHFGEALARKDIGTVFIARPNVCKPKHRNGFLPGSPEEKTAPWLTPILEGLSDAMPKDVFNRMKRDGRIVMVPFEFMQGRTFQDAACIVDEAENLDLDDLYITLTRQGDNLQMVLCGDPLQARISDSGLTTVTEMARAIPGVGIVEFTEKDVTRSEQARLWVEAFRVYRNKHPSIRRVA